MQIERIEQRIESYTSSLAHAVNEGKGAQFSMLLSLINTTEDLAQKKQTSSTGFSLPEPQALEYPDPDSLYDGEVVQRLNTAVHDTHQGDFAYLLSHIAFKTATPTNVSTAADQFARIGLASAGRLMLDEIDRSGQQFSAQA